MASAGGSTRELIVSAIPDDVESLYITQRDEMSQRSKQLIDTAKSEKVAYEKRMAQRALDAKNNVKKNSARASSRDGGGRRSRRGVTGRRAQLSGVATGATAAARPARVSNRNNPAEMGLHGKFTLRAWTEEIEWDEKTGDISGWQ